MMDTYDDAEAPIRLYRVNDKPDLAMVEIDIGDETVAFETTAHDLRHLALRLYTGAKKVLGEPDRPDRLN